MLTAYTSEIAAYGKPTSDAKHQYCRGKGYQFFSFWDKKDFAAERDPTWSKIPFILKVFSDPAVQWVFWTDADAAVVNTDVWIENLVDEKFDLIISRDQLGINAGNFLMRNSGWSRELLLKAWSREDLARTLFHEQQAISELIDADWQGARARVKFVSQRLFNSYHYPDYVGFISPLKGDGSFGRSDFILHVPAKSGAFRLHRLRRFFPNSRPAGYGSLPNDQPEGALVATQAQDDQV